MVISIKPETYFIFIWYDLFLKIAKYITTVLLLKSCVMKLLFSSKRYY